MLSVYREHGVVLKDAHTNHNQTAEDRSIYQLLDPGWLAVNRMKAWQGSVGISPHRGIISGHYICFEPTHDEVDRYLHYLLRSPAMTAHFNAISRGVRPGQIEIDNDELAATKLRLPSVTEQRRIADFLDDRVARINRITAARRSQESFIEERFASQRRAAVVGSDAPSKRTDLPWSPRIPTAWPVRRLSQVARIGTGHTPSRSQPEYWTGCHVPWLTTSDVHRFRRDEIDRIDSTTIKISDLGLANSAAVLHPKNTVALSRTASAGFSIVMNRSMATSQDFVTWTCGPKLRPEYLLHSLRVMRTFLLGYLATGSTHKTIYFPDLMDLRIPLPPVNEQDAAIAKIEACAAERSGLSDSRCNWHFF